MTSFAVRVTEEEKQELTERAEDKDLSLSAYVRHQLLKQQDGAEMLLEWLSEIETYKHLHQKAIEFLEERDG